MQRTLPAGGGDERETLTGWLDWQRATVDEHPASQPSAAVTVP